jgi:TolB protein
MKRLRGYLKTNVSFIVLSFIVFSFPLQAMLRLELTKGVDGAIPIAVLPFKAVKPIKMHLSDIIRNDLAHSGEFKVLPLHMMPETPKIESGVNVSAWHDKGVDYLVLGQLNKETNNQYHVKIQLLSLYQTGAMKTMQSVTKLFDKTFVFLRGHERRAAHKIADVIYQKLTGATGVFSTKLAYVLETRGQTRRSRRYALMIADADGHHPRAILKSTQPIMSPAWSVDGQSIAYVSFENKRVAIYISNLVTGKRRRITQFEGINGAPAFSPDGKRLALVLSKTGYPKLYVMDIATKELTQITKGWSIDTEPAWSKDGRSLLFTSDRSGCPQIYQVNLRDHQVKRVTYEGNYNARPSFTSDGHAIVMLHRDSTHLFHIAKQDLKTGRVTVLSRTGEHQSPSISPNGKMVIYTIQRRHGNDALEMVSTNGQVRLRLPETKGAVREPVWGPVSSSS